MTHLPAGVPLPDFATLTRCWDRNSHGAGFMYTLPSSGVLRIHKGLMTLPETFAALNDLYTTHANLETGALPFDLGLHFRIGTHGANVAANTHPWWIVPGKVALMHNGMIRGLNPATISGADVNASDSQHFAALLAPLFRAALSKRKPDASILGRPGDPTCPPTRFARSVKPLAESFIDGGYPNKVLIYDNNGGFMILGGHKGEYLPTGQWWSNDGFKSYDLGSCDPRGFTSKTKPKPLPFHAGEDDDRWVWSTKKNKWIYKGPSGTTMTSTASTSSTSSTASSTPITASGIPTLYPPALPAPVSKTVNGKPAVTNLNIQRQRNPAIGNRHLPVIDTAADPDDGFPELTPDRATAVFVPDTKRCPYCGTSGYPDSIDRRECCDLNVDIHNLD